MSTWLQSWAEYIARMLEENPYQLISSDDLFVEHPICKDKLILGFSIIVQHGYPLIEIVDHRGKAKIIATWGGEQFAYPISRDVANKVSNIIEEMMRKQCAPQRRSRKTPS